MRVAILGCSAMGSLHAAMATSAGFEVVACADTNASCAEALAETYGARVYKSPATAIKQKSVDVVVIATPTPAHLGQIEQAAAAGKAIFCEKPFCRTVADCKAAMRAAKKAKVKLFVGHVVRYFHEFEAMAEQVQSGIIGAPGYVKIARGGMFPGGGKTWFGDYKASGGVTLDCMIHDFDWVRYVFGEPERIYCRALQRTEPVPMDYAQATMRMESGVIANFVGTWAHPSGFRVTAEICGTEGLVQFDSDESSLHGMQRQSADVPSVIVPRSPVSRSPYRKEWEEFAAWIRDDVPPRVSHEDALMAVRMAEAALQSADSGKPVRF